VPTLNEEGNIRELLRRTARALSSTSSPWEIIVVDDASSDATGSVVAEYSRNAPQVRLVVRENQQGLAGAISDGWLQSTAELLGVIDADLQHPPELLPELLQQIENGADIAIASRYVRADSMAGWNPVRRLLSRMSVIASVPVQRREIRVRDPLSGFFIVRRECIEGLEFQRTGFKLLLEILNKGRIKSVAEVPFGFGLREHGASKASFMTGVHYISLLVRLGLRRGARTEQQD
jgi:dolichol-phosphate mannosyltransferase